MKEKKTGKDSGRLLHAVRVSKFLQVTVLAAGVLGMSAVSQSMTEISENTGNGRMRKAMRWNIPRIKRTGSRRLFLKRHRSKKSSRLC